MSEGVESAFWNLQLPQYGVQLSPQDIALSRRTSISSLIDVTDTALANVLPQDADNLCVDTDLADRVPGLGRLFATLQLDRICTLPPEKASFKCFENRMEMG